jgi:multidrug resistance efflux pump
MRLAAGRLLLTTLLLISLAAGQATAQTKSTKKRPKDKKPAAAAKDSGKSSDDDKTPSPEKKPDNKTDKKPAADAAKGTEKKEPAKKEPEKPATVKVKKGPFHIDVSLDGVFEAQDQAEVVVRPQEWPLLQVLKAVDHGTPVKQGDLILALDTEKIDHTITDLRAELQLNELAVKQSETQLAALEKVAPLDTDANERAQRMAKEDFKLYQDVEKPLSVKINEYRLKASKEQLEYAEEEYRQLEKMYKADDLREETEKIVLRRAKNGVDRAKLSLELAQASYDEAKKLSLPRQDERAKEVTERALIDVDLTRASIPLLMSKHRLELEKLKLARTQGEERLTKLNADREAMVVKAPIDGIVYYGRCVRGKWAAMSHETLRRGANVQPNDVVMTIVKARPMIIRTTVPESQAQRIHSGQTAYVEPVGFVNKNLTAVVHRVSPVPLGSSGFDCQLTVASDALNDAIMPGMNCEMKVIPYKKSDALTVPPKSVFTEDLDPLKQYVYLVGKNGKPQKRTVTTGEHNEKQVEVLSGLAAGDEILQEKPKEE